MSTTLTITESSSNRRQPALDDLSLKSKASFRASSPGLRLEENGIELNDLSTNPSPGPSRSVTAVTPEATKKERIVFFTLCWCLFLAGWNDATLGPLLPRIREEYGVGFTVVSIMFISNCVGFISGAAANIHLSDKLGFGKSIVLGGLLQVAAYTILAPAPPFPVLCIAYVINGFGIAIQDAQANSFVASVHSNSNAKMGILHAAYGVGAFASPLVATQFAQLPRWSFHFLCSLGLSLTNAAALIFVIRGKALDELLAETGSPQDPEAHVEDRNKYKQIMGTKVVHLLAFFIFVYVGVEVTLGGWIVTFIIEERRGGPSSGYISSGFFGGLALGRVVLLWLNRLVGEKRVIYLYGLVAIGLEFIIWFVPSLIGNAVAVSIIGLLLGPMYPICMNQAGRVLPRSLLSGSIGWIAGFGQAGSAALPFMTGALASKFGISALQPLLVAMMACMLCLWALVPNPQRRED